MVTRDQLEMQAIRELMAKQARRDTPAPLEQLETLAFPVHPVQSVPPAPRAIVASLDLLDLWVPVAMLVKWVSPEHLERLAVLEPPVALASRVNPD